jgi:hypothetical protein
MSANRLAAAMSRIDQSLAAKRAERAANQTQAPICAAFVADVRDAFGAGVAVTYVSEGDFVLGKPDERRVVDGGTIALAVRDEKREREHVVARWIHLQERSA